MQLSPRYNFRYPELTDQISAFPPDVAAQNALLLDQVIGSLADNTDAELAGKAPTSHTHSMGQVTGLEAELAGKAPTSHTHSMGQVTGLEAELAGKAAQTTLDTRVPSALALRLDTTVGTRIFAGNKMIFGDTGWRDVRPLLVNGWKASVFQICRINSATKFLIYNLNGLNATADAILKIPMGFQREGFGLNLAAPSTAISINGYSEMLLEAKRAYFGMNYNYFELPFVADPWPASLPGTPV